MRTTVVLFQIHYFDRWAERAFRDLRAGAPAGHEFVVLMHLPPGAPVPDRVARYPHHVVRTPELRALPYPAKVGGEDWNLWHAGHTDLILMHFWRAHPDYDRYWSVEYDVRYSGPWRRFLAMFEDDDSDLLATMICRQRDYPDWLFWPSLVSPGTPPSETEAVSSFMPIFRATGRMMRAMDEAYREGWGGHLECSFATVAAVRGLSLADLGGNTEFTPEARRGRIYSGTVHDLYHAPGTFVFKPTLFRPGSRPDMLWHPVKPFWLGAEVRRELLVARSALAGFVRKHAPWLLPARWRRPGSFTRPRTARGS